MVCPEIYKIVSTKPQESPEGIEEVLEQVVALIPEPEVLIEEPLQA